MMKSFSSKLLSSPGRFLQSQLKRWQERGTLNNEDFDRLNLDFQPASLAIQNRPPHPASKIVARMLMAIFSFGVIWASLGSVDIVATAQGRLIPQSRIKVVQPIELGKVTHLPIKEGQRVGEGDVLIVLDSTQISAEITRIESQQNDYNMREQGLEKLLLALEKSTNQTLDKKLRTANQFIDSNNTSPAYLSWLKSQWQDFQQQQGLQQQQYITQQRSIVASQATLGKFQRTLPLIIDKAESMSALHQQQSVSRLEYLGAEQERIAMEQDLSIERKRLASMQSELASIQDQQQAHKATTRKDWQQQKLDYQQESQRLNQELDKIRDRFKKHTLYAPVDGLVKDLSVTTIGAVVSPGDELLTIVPTADILQMEAFVENKDIGFIEEGQEVEVKINTFNFTKYGVITGKLVHISSDAVSNEQRGSEQPGYVFPVRIELEKDYLFFNGKKLRLQPGMESTVEIKTGTRRLIEFFLSPLLRHKAESLNER